MASLFGGFAILFWTSDRETNANLATLSQWLFSFTFKIILDISYILFQHCIYSA